MSTNNSDALTMLVGAVAGMITVAASSGLHDFSDTMIGIVIGLLMWPLIKSKKSRYTRVLVSAISGLSILLIVGVIVDAILGKTCFHVSHFLVWLAASVILYFLLPAIEREYNKSSNPDGTKPSGS